MLSDYQKTYLSNFRSDERDKSVALWTETKTKTDADADSDDPYTDETITSGSRFFSGSVSWGRTYERSDSQGGFSAVSDITVTCGSEEESYLKAENSYMVIDTVKLRLKRFVKCEDTSELILFCERLM